eukprot:scaffold121_cov412-Prasinococcus_capsulatus_cf.AAC.8
MALACSVGYVEDEESPEMIMKKFEELERLQKEQEEQKKLAAEEKENIDVEGKAKSNEPTDVETEGLNEEQLEAVFKQTSSFSLKSAVKGNDVYFQDTEDILDEGAWARERLFFEDDEGDYDYDDYMYFYENDDCFWEDEPKERKQKRAGRKRIPGDFNKGAVESRLIATFHQGVHMLVKRKVRKIDPNEILKTAIPKYPIPASWARTIAPYKPPHVIEAEKQARDGSIVAVQDPLDTLDASIVRDYMCVMISPPWQAAQGGPGITIEDFQRLPIRKLCARGFVCVWVEKHVLGDVVEVLDKWSFDYIENFTWVLWNGNTHMKKEAAPYFCKSHTTMLMFRKYVRPVGWRAEGKEIELRHQRTPDVVSDFVRVLQGTERKPEQAYKAVETLLPDGMGQFLELWATDPRKGWTSVIAPATSS